jgi:hypothetical protein
MENNREAELDCKRRCEAALQECEEGSIYTEECESQRGYCMNECAIPG